jgi:CubicO group peptidase (beta-lactamase class C family)
VTIRHLLTHTAGVRWVEVGGPETPWKEIVARICAAKLEPDWPLGLRAGYHPMTSWFIVGELVGRASGKHFRDYVRSDIFLPLGMNDSWIGMPAERFLGYGDRIAIMSEMDKPDRPPYRYSLLSGATACFPGANGYGPARELGHIYEMLLGQGEYNGVRVLQPSSVEQMTARQRQGMYDETFKHVMDWGLGLILNSARYGAETVPYGYGPYASDKVFGHSGSQSSLAFADPEHGLAVAAVMNGMPGEQKHQRRIRAVCAAIYEDLGLSN